jgi:hypothetical protein
VAWVYKGYPCRGKLMRKDTRFEITFICLIMNIQGFANIQNIRSLESFTTTSFPDAFLVASMITPTFSTFDNDLKMTGHIEIAQPTGTADTSRLYDTTVKRTATPIGTTVSCTIDVEGVGPSEYGQHELHDVKVTVLEVVRGNKAWELIRAADASNRPVDMGFDYVLARIRFEYSMQSSQGDMPYTLKQGCFKLYSADNKEYPAPSIESPQPGLVGKVFYPGFSLEGWVSFMAATNDKPFLFYTSGSVWFQL